MRGAENNICQVGPLLHQAGNGLQGHLDAFVRIQQAKGHQNRAPLEAKVGLSCLPLREGNLWNAVVDEVYLFRWNTVDHLQEIDCLLAHHNEGRTCSPNLLDDLSLIRRRALQDGVQCDDHRKVQPRHQV